MTLCHVCGAGAPGADPRSPLCPRCQPVAGHTISMTIGDDGLQVATCKGCGWSGAAESHETLDASITAHWQEAVVAAENAGAQNAL